MEWVFVTWGLTGRGTEYLGFKVNTQGKTSEMI